MTGQILELKEHLLAENVTVVVMEATGDYWRPYYYVLEEELNVILVNARDARNVPGRKTEPARRTRCRHGSPCSPVWLPWPGQGIFRRAVRTRCNASTAS